MKDLGERKILQTIPPVKRTYKCVFLFLLITEILLPSTGGFLFASTASYYTVASCKHEGTSGVMANGRKLDDRQYTCASWDYAFGTVLRITNLGNGKTVYVKVSDRGPNMRLYRMGRIIDLSYAAMYRLDGIKQGVIEIKIEVIK
jgi:rare lipoprotein A (peptidoglycan hydrolase)